CFRMPRHRAALARNVEADGKLASGKLGRIAHETELDAIAPDRAPRRHRHARLAAEGDRLIGPLDQRGPAHLQAHEHVVEGDGLRAEYVAQPQPRLPSPNIGPHDQAKSDRSPALACPCWLLLLRKPL